MSGTGSVVVFAHAHILLPVKSILHLPVDGIGYFVVGLTRAMMKAGSFNLQDLSRVRKRCKFRIVLGNRDGGDLARFLATMAVVVGVML
jgi:hypothetical protein